MSYPADLPLPTLAGYSFVDLGQTSVQNTEVGMPIVIRETNDTRTVYTVRWIFTRQQRQVFENWFTGTLNYGAESFSINLIDDGVVSEPIAVYFRSTKQPYGVNLINDHYIVQAQLREMNGDTVP